MAVKQQKAVNDSPENVLDVLLGIMNKLGIREANIPGKDECGILIHHLITQYGNHSCDEIRLAFDMAIAGNLDLLPGESVNCYENFSCLYVSSIMNAYRRWAVQAHRQLVADFEPEQQPEDTSDEAMEKWLLEIKKIPIKVDLLPVMLYDWLEQKDRIKKTAAEKHEYLQEAVMYRQSKLIKAFEEHMNQQNRDTLQDFNRMKESGEFTGSEVSILKALAKKIILFEYLNEAQ